MGQNLSSDIKQINNLALTKVFSSCHKINSKFKIFDYFLVCDYHQLQEAAWSRGYHVGLVNSQRQTVVSVSKKCYTHCTLLVGSTSGFRSIYKLAVFYTTELI